MTLSEKIKAIVLLGPTAVGKSEIAVELAEKINAEIVSADSMQVYRHMDIGTAKPSGEMTRRVRHHMLDVALPDEIYNVARYYIDALDCIRDIHTRGKHVLVVGGAGMYLKRLISGIFTGSGHDPLIRKKLEEQAKTKGIEHLFNKLKEIDPVSAKRIHPNNKQRVLRALEVYEISGKPISVWQEEKTAPDQMIKYIKVGLNLSKNDLYQRIDQRLDAMLACGLVREVEFLQKRFQLTPTVRKAVGYKEILMHLDGKIGLEEAKSEIKKSTRMLVKKQLTWFSNDDSISWFNQSSGRTQQTIEITDVIMKDL